MDVTHIPSSQPRREQRALRRAAARDGIVEELLVDDGEAAEAMAAQERTFRVRAADVVQPSWRADAEWTLSGVTPYRRGVAGSAEEHEVFRRQVTQLAVDEEVRGWPRSATWWSAHASPPPWPARSWISRSTREAAWWPPASG